MNKVLASLMIIFIIASLPILRAENNYVRLVISVRLLDNTPLSGAIVIIKPSIYSTQEYSNITDKHGYAEIVLDKTLFEKKAYIIIKYWVYGDIYHNYIYLSENILAQTISIKLNYTALCRNYRVVNEYLKPLNGTYDLLYSSRNKLFNILSDKIDSGTLFINNTDHILLFNEKLASNYILLIHIDNQTYKLKLSMIENNTIIIDTEKPIIQILKKKASYNEKTNTVTITVLFNVIDGVLSEKVHVEGYVIFDDKKALMKIDKINTTRKNNLVIICYEAKTTILSINLSNTVQVYIVARDSSGKSTNISTGIPIEKIIETSTHTTNHTSETNYTTSIFNKTTTSREEIISNETFAPTNILVVNQNMTTYIFIAVIITLISLTIYLDIKYFRREE